jgi:hypothetical protein
MHVTRDPTLPSGSCFGSLVTCAARFGGGPASCLEHACSDPCGGDAKLDGPGDFAA